MKINPTIAIDYYKSGHIRQYPEGTTFVYANGTFRSSKLAKTIKGIFDEKVVFFGMQGFIKWFLIDCWNEAFFNQPKDKVLADYQWHMDQGLGPGVDISHIAELHDKGYLPVRIKALPEGSRVNIKVPAFTICNTHPNFFWLTNYLEDVLSNNVWKASTTATTAWQYRKLLDKYAEDTGANKEFVVWQGHDFSFRGVGGIHDGSANSAGHLLSFLGTDTISSIDYLKNYYSGAQTYIGGSVPATEHSVMCMGGEADELETFRHLIEDVYKTGVVSIVSDTWDFWKVITETAAKLKDKILARQPNALGLVKVVFRPDSGDPADIICGLCGKPGGQSWSDLTPEYELKGAVECLWDIFGGTINEAGYKELNPRVGLIYGDSITLDRAQDILERLKAKGFASSNIVFGIGSFTYQYQTRDSYGFAMKATFGTVNGIDKEIFKLPKTGDGTKNSAKGLLRVEKIDDDFVLFDQQTRQAELQGELKLVFEDGKLYNEQTLEQIRKVLHG